MDRERNLLFGVLALQSGKVAPDRLAPQVSAWTRDPTLDLPQRLMNAGVLSQGDCDGLITLAELTARSHGNDAAALAAFSGDDAVRRVFGGAVIFPEAGPRSTAVLLRGSTLRDLMDKAQTLRDRLTLLPHLIDLCQTLGAAHGRGVIHRNVHPRAVLITEFGETVVTDWRFSKLRGRQDLHAEAFEQSLDALRAGAAAASEDIPDPAYLAPELALGHMDAVDARSDVYALGALLYELLTGKPPFTGKTPGEVLRNVASGKPERITALEPAAPAEVVALCERAMHREPSARYSSARPLAEELRRVQSLPASREPVHGPVDAGDPYKILLGAVAALVLLVVGMGVFAYRAGRERDEALLAQSTAEEKRATAEENRDKTSQAIEEAHRALRDAETERDQALDARNRAQEALKQIEQARQRAESALAEVKKPHREPEETAGPSSPPEAAPNEPSAPPAPAKDKVATPPSIPIVSPGEEESGERPADAQQRAAGLSKAELAKALPDLISSLKTEQTLDGQVEVVVRAEGPQVPAGLQRLGFKDGDIITRVNRTAIESAEQAQRALANVKNDLGFTIRVVRDGQSSWMRISVSEAAPSPKGAPDSAKRPVLPPPQPPAKPPAAEQAAPAEEPAPSTEEPPETPSDEPPK